MGPVTAALLLAAAVGVWPTRGERRGRQAGAVLEQGPAQAALGRVVAAAGLRLPWRRTARDNAQAAALLALVEALGAGLRAGLTPADALTTAVELRRADAQLPPALEAALPTLQRRARAGEGLGEAWGDVARASDSRELLLLSRAWALSERSGASLAAAATTTARLVRADRDRLAQADTAVAGARTTMTILTLLPLAGPLLAAAMGLDLARLYATSPAVWGALAAGVALVVAGRWWVGRLVAASMSGPVLR